MLGTDELIINHAEKVGPAMTAVHRSPRQRLGWQDIPVGTRSALAFELGAGVVRALRQESGLDGALAARLLLDDGRWAFLRALPADHPRRDDVRAEAAVTARLPETAPVPRLLAVVETEWLAVVFSDLDGARPNLRPGSPDCSATLSALGKAARALTPSPIDELPTAHEVLDRRLRCWREPATLPDQLDPWARRYVDRLAAVETAWGPWADGDTLLHTNPSPETMVRTGTGRVLLTGWREPARGAAWLDIAMLVPYLLTAGHDVAGAERLVLSRTELRAVPAWAVTGYAVALCGYWLKAGAEPEPAGSVGLRARQRQAGQAALGWVRHRTRW